MSGASAGSGWSCALLTTPSQASVPPHQQAGTVALIGPELVWTSATHTREAVHVRIGDIASASHSDRVFDVRRVFWGLALLLGEDRPARNPLPVVLPTSPVPLPPQRSSRPRTTRSCASSCRLGPRTSCSSRPRRRRRASSPRSTGRPQGQGPGQGQGRPRRPRRHQRRARRLRPP
jgi:hypothetical protein